DLPQETNPWLRLYSCALENAGDYRVIVSNDSESVPSKPARLKVLVPLPYASYALGNTSSLAWNTWGDVPWSVESDSSHDATAALQSGAITDGQRSALETSVTGPGVVTFWWAVSSEPDHDKLTFAVNGETKSSISGEVNWGLQRFIIPAG